MEEQLNEILIRMDYLEKMYDISQQNLSLTWTILGVMATIIIVATIVSVRSWVNTRVDKELGNIKEQLKKIENRNNQLTEQLNNIKVTSYETGNWTPFLSFGNHFYENSIGKFIRIEDYILVQFDIEIREKDSNANNEDFLISGLPFANMERSFYGGSLNEIQGFKDNTQIILDVNYNNIYLKLIEGDKTSNCKIGKFEDRLHIKGSISYKI